MKTRSVASLAVLLSLGMLAVVTLIKDDNGISEESEDRSMLQYDNEIAEESDDNTPAFRMRRKRVKALANRLKLDDWSKLTILAKYIENEGWKEQCSKSDEDKCALILVSFSVSDESRSAETNDQIVVYKSWYQEDYSGLSLKKAGQQKTLLVKPINPNIGSEDKFTIFFAGANELKFRVDWVFSYAWDPELKKEYFFVGVMSNDGYKCYSTAGVNECFRSRQFAVKDASSHPHYTDAWSAFDNALLFYEESRT